MRTALVCGSLLAAMAVFAAFPLIALDLPLHLAMGELILDRGAVPPTNVVLHTQENTPCVNDKWLHQVAVALVHRAAGTAGLHGLRWGLVLATVLATFALARRLAPPGPAAVAVLSTAPLLVHRLALRPELWSDLFTALFLLVLLAPRADRPARLLALVPFQVLWANLHVYFLLGPALALLIGATRTGARRRWSLALGGLLALASLLTPAGPAGLLQPFRVAASLTALGEGAISEAAAIWSPSVPWALPRVGLVAAAALALVGLLRARGRLALPIWLAALPLIALGTVLHRNLPLAGLGILLLLAAAPPLRAAWLDVALVPAAAAAAILLVAAGPLADPALDGRSFGTGWSERMFPFRAARFLAEQRPAGEIFNDIASGGCYVFVAFPERRAFIDGNTSGYPPSFLEEYRRVLALDIPHRALIRKYRVTHFLLRHDAPATRFLVPALFRDEGLVLAFYDPAATVFLARELAPGLADRRRDWLRDVLPHVRDALFPEREQVKPLLREAAALVTSRPEGVADLAGRACLLDPWEAHTFRVSAMAYRRQGKPDLEGRALRAAALLEEPAPR
ncbi:MAG: hypothetical protein JXQ29_17380 [Planctomycetes bacterium]|nr:hypothetical protein [Planctomycetota bacterium]